MAGVSLVEKDTGICLWTDMMFTGTWKPTLQHHSPYRKLAFLT